MGFHFAQSDSGREGSGRGFLNGRGGDDSDVLRLWLHDHAESEGMMEAGMGRNERFAMIGIDSDGGFREAGMNNWRCNKRVSTDHLCYSSFFFFFFFQGQTEKEGERDGNLLQTEQLPRSWGMNARL